MKETIEKIIDYDVLEERLIEVEGILDGLDTQEKLLVLNFIRQRIAKSIQDTNVKDTINSNPLIKMANKFMKDKGEN